MSRSFLSTLATITLFIVGISVQARADAIILQENFNTLTPGTYTVGAITGQFHITSGSIDVIDNGDFGLPCADGGRCVDLDGSSAETTTLQSLLSFGPGTYRIQFDLAGSQRGDTNTLVVSLADTSMTFTLPSDAPFTTFSFLVTIPETLFVQPLIFTHGPSGDSSGLLLDNVSVSTADPIPEPATMFLLGTGLAGIAAKVRRHRKTLKT